MTQTEILNECKQDIAIGLGLESWKHLIEDNNWNKYGRYASKELAILFAHRMAEKFAEWIADNFWVITWDKYWINSIKIVKTTSELYAEFLTTINKDK